MYKRKFMQIFFSCMMVILLIGTSAYAVLAIPEEPTETPEVTITESPSTPTPTPTPTPEPTPSPTSSLVEYDGQPLTNEIYMLGQGLTYSLLITIIIALCLNRMR